MTDPTTSKARPFIQAEAFSPRSHPLLGNPCAVVLSSPHQQPLSPTQRQLFSAWTNLSETTFLLPPTDSSLADYKVHIHTTKRELPFAGHPTLCSARSWLYAQAKAKKAREEKDIKLASGDQRVITQECNIGLVKIRIEGKQGQQDPAGRLSLAAPGFIKFGPAEQGDVEAICAALGVRREDVLKAQWTDNGPGWCTLLLKSAQAVLEAKFSHKAPYNVGLVGPYKAGMPLLREAGLLPSDEVGEEEADVEDMGLDPAHFEVRAFHDELVDEDPVTGSLNAGIARWLIEGGLAPKKYVASQGRMVGRRGRVYVEAERGEGGEETIWVGGEAGVVIEGEVNI